MTTFDGSFRPGTFTPAPGRGSTWRMLRTHAKVETLLTLRHGEQILLTLLIPLALLIGMTVLDLVPADQLDDADPVGWTTPRILALAVMSSAFTGQAIALGFDRKYGVFKRLAATALPLWVLIGGRIVAGLCVATLQVLILGGVAAALGFRPVLAGVPMAVVLVLAGIVGFGALGVLLGGSLRAEIVLAVANLLWFVLLLAGGIVLAPESLPPGLSTVAEFLPSGALAEGLRAALMHGAAAWDSVAVLVVWGVVGAGLATRTTKLT
ncbi:ABC transporter permease [Thermocrispum agreste]|uniref:ABC transporter permease n=1 Tax=Thermocrispum agreste TaxID=37925 RepID=UPI0004001C06|nr:ABC transporter permease [Thermocrispum agreste]